MEVIVEMGESGERHHIEMGLFDSILSLKLKIQRCSNVPVSSQNLFFNNLLLEDHRHALFYRLVSGCHIYLANNVPAPSSTTDSLATGQPSPDRRKRKRTLTFHVTVYQKKSKATVEVHPGKKVEELRKWLERVRERIGFELPEEGYFFIHNQDVMREEQSFRWHNFKDGDAVEVFPGTVIRRLG